MSRLRALAHAIDTLNEWIGRVVAWLTLGMVFVTFLVVVLRYGFNWGSIAMQESVTYFHALVFMAGAAYTFKHDEHVRVDIFYRKFSARVQASVNLLGSILLLIPVSLFILWESWDYVSIAWSLREGSQEAGGLPLVFLLKSCIPLMAILLALQGIAGASHSLVELLTKARSPTPPSKAGL